MIVCLLFIIGTSFNMEVPSKSNEVMMKKSKMIYDYVGTKDSLQKDIDAVLQNADLNSILNAPLQAMLTHVEAMTSM